MRLFLHMLAGSLVGVFAVLALPDFTSDGMMAAELVGALGGVLGWALGGTVRHQPGDSRLQWSLTLVGAVVCLALYHRV